MQEGGVRDKLKVFSFQTSPNMGKGCGEKMSYYRFV